MLRTLSTFAAFGAMTFTGHTNASATPITIDGRTGATFGISLGAFKIAGALMLLLMSIDMMRAQPSPARSTVEEQVESCSRDDIAIYRLDA